MAIRKIKKVKSWLKDVGKQYDLVRDSDDTVQSLFRLKDKVIFTNIEIIQIPGGYLANIAAYHTDLKTVTVKIRFETRDRYEDFEINKIIKLNN